MMMWEAAYIGVSIPRGVPGRGTAVDDDDAPVEVQGYWTPDPRRAEKKGDVEDLAILAALRPAEQAHRALKVQLDEKRLYDLDAAPGKDEAPPNWWAAIQAATFVPALEFELSPKAAARDLTRALDLTKRGPDIAFPADVDATGGADQDEDDERADELVDLDEQYEPEQEVRAYRAQPGDRMLVEPAADLWAVIELAESDPLEDSLVVIDWRGDTGDVGELSMNGSDLLTIRRPYEDVDL